MLSKYMFKTLLSHPLTRNLDIDAPETTIKRSRLIKEKPFLRKIYEEWHSFLITALSNIPSGPVLELGSGGGFLKEQLPGLITSEVFYIPHVDIVLKGSFLPFRDQSLSGIVMIDVFHHINHSETFLAEVERCVKIKGKVVMVEPWVTPWSRIVYKHLHHELFEPEREDWGFPETGPLSGANGALPWIVFQRDKKKFMKEFPGLAIENIHLMMPFRYILSGGVSMRNLMPGWTFPLWGSLENLFKPTMNLWAMFGGIVLKCINK
jgi:SAM-dependent methyltransferase